MSRRLQALVLSIGVHALLVAILVPRMLPEGGDEEETLFVEMVRDEPASPGPPAVTEPPATTPAPPVPDPVEVPRSRPHPRHSSPVVAVAPAPEPGTPEASPAASPAPVVETPPPEPPVEDLTKISWSVLAKSVELPQAGKEKEKFAPEHHDSVVTMLEEYEGNVAAVKKVEQGQYDPELLALRDSMEMYWHPGFEHIHENPLDGASGKLLGQWKKSAQKYGKTGSPYDEEKKKGPPDLPGEDGTLGILDAYDQVQESGAFTRSVTLLVDISFDGEGGWKVDVVKPSGYGDFDEAALASLDESLSSSATPKPDEPMETRWALEADFSVNPPLPVAGFTFDIALEYFELQYPLKKSVSARIRLVSVKSPAAEPASGSGGKSDKLPEVAPSPFGLLPVQDEAVDLS